MPSYPTGQQKADEWKVTAMAAKRDYYEILGIDKNADDNTIKKAYRKLAKKYHPDQNAGNAQAERQFKEVTEAYSVLSDPEKKKIYDQFGHAAFDGSAPDPDSFTRGGGGNGGFREFHFEQGNMDDIFGDIFSGIFHGKEDAGRGFSFHGFGGDGFTGHGADGRGFTGSGFGSHGFGGNGFAGGDVRMKGQDMRAQVEVSFDEAVFGCDKVISLQNAEGRVQSLQVHIPAGIEDGKSVRLKGKGMPGYGGGKPGDLLLKVKTGSKPGFERKGMDVYSTISIPFTTAVFGGEVPVQTLSGKIMCKIREGTQSGSKIRLKGKGIVSMKNSSVHGDHYVTVQIQVPKNLSREAKEKLKEYEEACGAGRHGSKKGSAA